MKRKKKNLRATKFTLAILVGTANPAQKKKPHHPPYLGVAPLRLDKCGPLPDQCCMGGGGVLSTEVVSVPRYFWGAEFYPTHP